MSFKRYQCYMEWQKHQQNFFHFQCPFVFHIQWCLPAEKKTYNWTECIDCMKKRRTFNKKFITVRKFRSFASPGCDFGISESERKKKKLCWRECVKWKLDGFCLQLGKFDKRFPNWNLKVSIETHFQMCLPFLQEFFFLISDENFSWQQNFAVLFSFFF